MRGLTEKELVQIWSAGSVWKLCNKLDTNVPMWTTPNPWLWLSLVLILTTWKRLTNFGKPYFTFWCDVLRQVNLKLCITLRSKLGIKVCSRIPCLRVPECLKQNSSISFKDSIPWTLQALYCMYPVEITHTASQQKRLCLGRWFLEWDPSTHAGWPAIYFQNQYLSV